jgi:C-methyltransferase
MTQTLEEGITAGQLHGIARGFVKTALLRTAFELRLFDLLADGPRTAAELASGRDVPARSMRILLDGLAAIGLLRTDSGRYALLPGSDDLLLSNGGHYFGHAMRLSASDWEWDAQKDLADAVRKGGTVATTHVMTPDFDYWRDFATYTSWWNNGAADLMADELAPWAATRESVSVLDVACGHGSYGFQFAQQEPRARLWSLDWPSVLEITRQRAEMFGVADRTSYIPGDMFEVPLGGPYDIVMLTNVLHHFDEATATRLLTRVAGAVKPGGRIAVVGHTYDDGDSPETNPLPYMFSVIMLVQSDAGETHNVATYLRMLSKAGLVDARSHTSPQAMHRVFIAERP